MMTVFKIIGRGIYFAAVSFGLAGCNFPLSARVNTQTAAEIYHSTDASMTQQIQLQQPSQTQSAGTPEPQVITPTSGPQKTSVVTESLLAQTPTLMCDRVKPGDPVDVTVPDDTRMQPGESFTKIWRFENDGACTWTKDYAVIWFSGEELGAEKVQSVSEPVMPGDSTDINVEMIAPVDPGIYSSYWMMRDDQGELFGLGPNGNAPFWVRIQVVAVNTATPTATVEPTATPVVQVSGSASLEIAQTFDLDSGNLAQDNEIDLSLILENDNVRKLVPLNNARLGVFGQLQPAEVDCRGAVLSADPLDLTVVEPDDYICYRTNLGLPGSLHVVQLPDRDTAFKFDYITWASP